MSTSAFSVSGSGGGGIVVQRVSTQTGAVATGTTTVPYDDTIPQNTEGDEYMTLSITPLSAANILVIDTWVFGGHSSSSFIISSLFQDSTMNALTSANTFNGVNIGNHIFITYVMTAGTTSATTFKCRVGGKTGDGGTFTFNGSSGGRIFGGVGNSGMMVTEFTI